jgi:hypothetical protein
MPGENEQPTADSRQPKSPSRFKLIAIVSAVLVIEAVVIMGAMMVIAGPATVDASAVPTKDDVAGDDRIIETKVLHAKLPNARTGVTYLYDTEIYVQTKQRHVPLVQRELDQFHNEIRAEINAIWRTAEPHHFQEPNLENLTRRIHAMLAQRFGSEDDGQPIIRRCVLVMATGFRIDS